MCRMSRTSSLRTGTLVVYFWTVLLLSFGLARNLIHEMYIRKAYPARIKKSIYLVRFTVSLKSVIQLFSQNLLVSSLSATSCERGCPQVVTVHKANTVLDIL